MPVFQNILQAIGNTPLVRLNKVAGPDDAAVYAKCEFLNPGGAIKDRMALYILDKIEKDCRTAGFNLDFFVAGLGTGGTMSGAGKYLKEKFRGMRNIGVDPEGSVYLDYFKTGKLIQPHVYKVEGIGEDMLCKAMDFSVLDDVRRVDDKQSFTMARRLAREEGLFGGGSSGAAVHVAVDLAREIGSGKNIVVILPDSGSRYITKFYSDEWMKDNGFVDPTDRLGTVADLLGGKRPPVYTVYVNDTAKHAVDLMKKHGISQLPVIEKGNKA